MPGSSSIFSTRRIVPAVDFPDPSPPTMAGNADLLDTNWRWAGRSLISNVIAHKFLRCESNGLIPLIRFYVINNSNWFRFALNVFNFIMISLA